MRLPVLTHLASYIDLTLKAPITIAADDKFKSCYLIFEKIRYEIS